MQNSDQKLLQRLDQAHQMMLSTSMDGVSTASLKGFVRDGFDLIFWSFNTDRAAEQIRLNPDVQAVITLPDGSDERSLHIEGRCFPIKDKAEQESAHKAILQAHLAPPELLNDPFLLENKLSLQVLLQYVVIDYILPYDRYVKLILFLFVLCLKLLLNLLLYCLLFLLNDVT